MRGRASSLAALLAASWLALAPTIAPAASLTPPNLTAQTSIANNDLMLVWPTASSGPLKQIQWSVLQTQMQAALGSVYLQVGNNLSDVASAATARSNLGLGSAAIANTGTAGHALGFLDGANTWSAAQTLSAKLTTAASAAGGAGFNLTPGVAPTSPVNGDCWLTSAVVSCRINGTSQNLLLSGNNLSDVTAATARTNLGITATGADTTYAFRANNLSDLANAGTARTNLGLTTAATTALGTSGATIPLLSTANTWALGQTFSAKAVFVTATTATASISMPQGVAPTSPVNGDCWTTSVGVFCQINGSTLTLATTAGAVSSFNTRTGAVTLSAADVNTVLVGDTLTGKLTFVAPTTSIASFNLPTGTAPTVPVSGDVWQVSGAPKFYDGATAQTLAFLTSNITGSAAKWTTGRTLALTGDVTYTSPSFDGSGNVTAASTLATAQPAVHTWALAQTFTTAPIFTDQSGSRTALGLGTAATQNTGTSGANVPLLNGANNWSTTQTLTVAPVFTDQSGSRTALGLGGAATLAVGTTAGTVAAGNDSRFGGPTQNSQSAAYGFVLTDAGGEVYHPSADTTARIWTIPANGSVAFPVGTKIEIVNDTSAGVLTVAITTDTLVFFPTGSTGSRSIAANGMATLTKVTSTRWVITGTGVS